MPTKVSVGLRVESTSVGRAEVRDWQKSKLAETVFVANETRADNEKARVSFALVVPLPGYLLTSLGLSEGQRNKLVGRNEREKEIHQRQDRKPKLNRFVIPGILMGV